jgi:hypothetical protein
LALSEALDRLVSRFGRERRGATAVRIQHHCRRRGLVVATAITMLGKNVLDNLYSQLAGLF